MLKLKSKAIEVYYDEIQVIERINELKDLNCDEEGMYIIVNNSEEYHREEFEENDDMEVKGEETTLAAFKNLIIDGEALLDIFDDLELDEEHRDFYYKSLENEDILLYIDRDYIDEDDIVEEPYLEELFDDIEDDDTIDENEEFNYIEEVEDDDIF